MALPTSFASLQQTDEQLKEFDGSTWRQLARAEVVQETAENLTKKFHKVSVVNTGTEAVDLVKSLIPKGSSVFNGLSTTLDEIGFPAVVKANKDWVNVRESLGFDVQTDVAKRLALFREALKADYYVTSVAAITKSGELLCADGTGTRTSGIAYSAPNVVLIVGTQKIVDSYEKAAERVWKFCLPLESARVRLAYNAPASVVQQLLHTPSGSPFLANRIHVILVKEVLGY